MDDKENSPQEVLQNLKIHEQNSPRASSARQPLTYSNIMQSSPLKSQGSVSSTPLKSTSRVIDSLHSQIDELKSDLLKSENFLEESKKAQEILKKRRDQLMEQLSNTKHENDTINSLLQRKQRRITDLEAQLGDTLSSSDDMKFKIQTMEAKFNKMQENEASAVAEAERLKYSYNALLESQLQYKQHYTKEIQDLREQLLEFTKDKEAQITKNIGLINKSDATIYRSIKSITLRSKEIEEKSQQRDQILESRVENVLKKTKCNDGSLVGIFETTKELFEEVANKMEIDKNELLQKFIDASDTKANPLNEKFTPLSTDSLPPSSESSQPHQINIKKRSHKRTPSKTSFDQTPPSSVEERISSLGKELNKVIPSSDRTATIEPIQRSKSVKKSRPPSMNYNQRRLSKRFDEPAKNSHTSSRSSSGKGLYTIDTNTSTKIGHHTIETGHMNSDVADEDKKKKKPKKKRSKKNSNSNTNNKTSNSDDHDQENDFGDDSS